MHTRVKLLAGSNPFGKVRSNQEQEYSCFCSTKVQQEIGSLLPVLAPAGTRYGL
jgi:hypothetical protein